MTRVARTFAGTLAAISVAVLIHRSASADWPTFGHDARRSQTSAEQLDFEKLSPSWRWKSPQPPLAAWGQPAKGDAYSNLRDFQSMRNYDPVFHPIVAGDALYFGSNVDDTVRCLDAATGQSRWEFIAGGPVRIAPTFHDGRVYFGADDGCAYCLEAESGKLVWRTSPSVNESPRRVLNDGRLISFWPCRSGVLVDGDTAYFTCSLLPWKPSFLCAVDAKTGQPVGEGRYIQRLDGVTLEGPLVADSDLLYSPQGRESPLQFQRAGGKSLGTLGEGFGVFCVLTPQNRLLHGPKHKGGGIVDSDAKTRAPLATHKDARAMIVTADASYLLTNSQLAAGDLASRKMRWTMPHADVAAMIVAGDAIVLGQKDRVTALDVATGKEIWSAPVNGRAMGLVAAGGALFVSTETGQLVCFGSTGASPSQANVVDRSAIHLADRGAISDYRGKPLPIDAGPWMQFDTAASAVVRWETNEPTVSRLQLTDDANRSCTIADERPKTKHELRLPDLRRDRRYSIRIEIPTADQPQRTRDYELDTYFNYHPAGLPKSATAGDAQADGKFAAAAEAILKQYRRPHGLCLVVGAQTGELAVELARRGNLRVVGFETDEENVAAARRRAGELGIHGLRCSFVRVDSLEQIPVPSNVANLVVSQTALSQKLPTAADEFERLLQPGGMLILDAASAWVRGPLAGAADWTHMYGDAANAAYTGETLGGVKATDELEVAWLGRPGPRYQTDRQNRKSSPLFGGGRLYMQGQERIIALDGYNGLILWSLEIPGLLRFNIPRDAANWCCDQEHLFIAVRDRCWQIDGDTGRVVAMHSVDGGVGRFSESSNNSVGRLSKSSQDDLQNRPTTPREWGYLARTDDLILGSSVAAGSSYVEFWGEPYWFDQHDGPYTYQVCSDELFAVDKSSGQRMWTFFRGKIWNASLTVGGGRIYFIQSRGEKLAAKELQTIGRVPTADLTADTHLVALDLNTGKPVWEQKLDISEKVLLANMAYSDGRLVLVQSVDKTFPIAAFAADTGKPAWKTTVPWPRADHGGHLSRPAIVGKRLFVRPAVLDVATGEVLSNNIPGGGCGTYVCSRDALFFRAGSGRQLSTWHPETGKYTHWPRLRPDCWLSTIPAGGMLLSPEGGGGCSCGHWMEMSLGFQPKGR